jgi:hypothetical protein
MAGHFEIHAADVEAAKTFYAGLFGWTFSPMPGAEDMQYHLAAGSQLGDGLTIGLMLRMGPAPDNGSPIRGGTITIDVTDCDERYAWALENGGSEALPPADYPGVGRCAYVEDGQGNVVGFVAPEEGAA